MREGNYEAARLGIARYLVAHPREAGALELAGILLIQSQKCGAAVESFKRALKLRPERVPLLVKLGVLHMLARDFRTGERYLLEALARRPEDLLALRYLAWYAEIRGDRRAAVAFLERIVASGLIREGSVSDTHVALARLYNTEERFQDTVSLLAPLLEAVGEDRDEVSSALQLGLAYTALRRSADAHRILGIGYPLRSRDVNMLGWRTRHPIPKAGSTTRAP